MEPTRCAQCNANIPIGHACVISTAGLAWCGDVCAKKWKYDKPIPPAVMPKIIATFIF